MISKAEIEHLKDLARVEFGTKETEKLTKDLGEILEYVDQLKKADVSNVPEMTHALERIKNVFRADASAVALAKEEEITDLIGAFPEKENNYLKVKAIL